MASNTYDELGRLKTSTRNGQVNLATTYNYNVRSWLISSSSPLFNQTLYYNDIYAGSTARYNGNISAMSWKMSNESPTRGYKFSYDNLSRLTAANYLENGSANDHFNTAYAYDKQGNMTSLARKGNTGTATYGDIDVLTMTYAGNQLVKAEDTGSSVSLSASMDFKNNFNTTREYSYDANGNLIQDLNKGINGITYNLLNLPQTLTISNPLGSATNSYTYAADGRKLKTVIGGKTTDYCGNVIYENGVLKRILVEGGYIEGGTYYFYLTDHLGNNRVVANASGTVVQTNHYYPFGMSFAEGMQDSSQPYKYNGKELDTDRGLNLYDYSARYMDPALGRFSTVDPLAEKYYSISPYAYVGNNPMKFVDPDGKWIVGTDGKRATYSPQTGWSKNTPADVKRVGNSLLKTETGTNRLNHMIGFEEKISITISPETKKDGKTLTMGINNRSNVKEAKNGEAKVGEHKITIYEGSVKEAIKENSGVKGYAGLELEDAIGAVTGHESGHTDRENTKQSLENSNKGTIINDVEKRPNEIENKILEELKKKNNM